MKRGIPYGALLTIAVILAVPGASSAGDKIADDNVTRPVVHISEAVQSNASWNPEFIFEVNVSLVSLHREARPAVMCEVFGPVPENPGAIVGWGKQYQMVNLGQEGSFNGRVSIPYKVPSRLDAESAKRYECSLYLQDYNRGIFYAPGNFGAQFPAAVVKPGTPLVWQVGGDIPRE